MSSDLAFKTHEVVPKELFPASFEASMSSGKLTWNKVEAQKADAICRNFYKTLERFKNSTITYEQLSDMVNEIAHDSTKSDKYYPLQHRISSILAERDWTSFLNINILYEDQSISVSEALTKIHDSFVVRPEGYSLKEADGLYFNIVRVTDSNKDQWVEFVNKNANGDSVKGTMAFSPAIDYYDNLNTEVWVAFISNRPLTHPSEVDERSIEMFVTVATSEHSVFTTHMAIARAATTFPKEFQHKNISTKFHSFAAKFMHERYPDKLYMINNPDPNMRQIILDEFEKHELLDKVFIGDNYTNVEASGMSRMTVDDFKQGLAKMYPDLKSQHTQRYLDLRLVLEKSKQRDMIDACEKTQSPIILEDLGKDEFLLNKIKFIIKDSTGNIVSEIGYQEQHEELAWFFQHPYQFAPFYGDIGGDLHSISTTVPLITCDLATLANLGDLHGEITVVGEVG